MHRLSITVTNEFCYHTGCQVDKKKERKISPLLMVIYILFVTISLSLVILFNSNIFVHFLNLYLF